MKTALALRHVHFEDLGTLEPLLRDRGYDVRYVEPATADLSAIDAAAPELLVVLGGPIGAYDDEHYPFLRGEVAVVERRLASERPLLGICLGAQLIARALGARVAPMATKEIGFGPVTLTPEGEASPLAALAGADVLHWHGDRFELPRGATLLASTAHCTEQAFSRGSTVLGLQFHPELDPARLEHWLVGHACELAAAGVAPEDLRATARSRFETAPAARAIAGWLDGH